VQYFVRAGLYIKMLMGLGEISFVQLGLGLGADWLSAALKIKNFSSPCGYAACLN